ncbi:phage integrase N-terminal SAM-like domain-containing protein, partial [Chloroflexota bacterium]
EMHREILSPDKTEVSGSSPEWPTFVAKRQLSQGFKRPVKRSLSDAVEGFFLKCKLEDLTPETIEPHRLKLFRFVDYCSNCPIGDVSPVIIREFLGYIKDKYRLDVATVQRHLVSIKAFFRWMCGEGFIIYSPTVGVKVGGLQKRSFEACQNKTLYVC